MQFKYRVSLLNSTINFIEYQVCNICDQGRGPHKSTMQCHYHYLLLSWSVGEVVLECPGQCWCTPGTRILHHCTGW